MCIMKKTQGGRYVYAMRRLGIKKRLFFAYSLLVLVAVCLFLAVIYSLIVSTSAQIERASQEEIVTGYVQQVQSVLREMDTLSLQVTARAQLVNDFITLLSDGDDSNFYASNIMESIDASSLLATINSANKPVARISVYNWNGDYVSAGTLYDTQAQVEVTLRDRQKIQEQLAMAVESPRRAYVTDLMDDPWSNSATNRLFSVIRPLTNISSSAFFGLVSVQQDVRVFAELFETRNGVMTILLDSAGHAMLPTQLEPDFVERLYQAITKNGLGNTASFRMDSGHIASYGSVDMTGWRVVRVQMVSNMQGMFYVMLGGGIALFSLLVLAVYMLARTIVRPLEQFSAAIGRVSLSNMDCAMQDGYTLPEVAALNQSFRSMLGRLRESIDLEMKAYQYALQSQMNPHFLYNTLAMISATAQERGDGQVVTMCGKLSAMLRYLVNYESDNVALTEELAHVENYLDLMKMRYEDGFSYEIERCEGMEHIRIPKVVLQPLAENCFQHGFRSVRPPWFIHISVTITEDRWELSVSDNGGGMTGEEIAALNARITLYRDNIASNYPTLRLGGIGLVNTILRLSLMLNDGILYDIGRRPEGGTVIKIGGTRHDPRTDR